MPVEGAKEVAKVVVETSGVAASWIAAAFAAMGSVILGMWRYINGRISRAELDAALAATIKRDLDAHIDDERNTFQLLFKKHDAILEKHDAVLERVYEIGKVVARIEGKLDK